MDRFDVDLEPSTRPDGSEPNVRNLAAGDREPITGVFASRPAPGASSSRQRTNEQTVDLR
jgi:hypothetical protein